MKHTLSAALLLALLLAVALAGNAQEPGVAVTMDSIETIPPNVIPLMCNGGFETGDWTCWQDRTADPWSWIAIGNAFDGNYYMRQGGKEDSLTSTFQMIDMTKCDPAQPVWIVRSIRMHSEEPVLEDWSANDGILWSCDWNTELAWMWEFLGGQMVNDQWAEDVYRVENAVPWGCMLLWVATWSSGRPWPTYWDHDAYQAWCVPLATEPTYTVYLPLVEE